MTFIIRRSRSAALPLDEELSGAGLAANEGEAQEPEGLRFALPALLAIGRHVAAKTPGTQYARTMRNVRRIVEGLAVRIPSEQARFPSFPNPTTS